MLIVPALDDCCIMVPLYCQLPVELSHNLNTCFLKENGSTAQRLTVYSITGNTLVHKPCLSIDKLVDRSQSLQRPLKVFNIL